MHTLDKYHASTETEPGQIELRDALDKIDKMLCNPRIGHKLASVLSAVRGPDELEISGKWKDSTTNVIRRTAFPKTFEHNLKLNGESWYVLHTADRFDQSIRNLPGHFFRHIYSAARVLGLL